MPATIVTIPDPWAANTENLLDLIPSLEAKVARQNGDLPSTIVFGGSDAKSTREVRRPLSGISVKPNTYAYITVVGADGRTLKIFNDLGSTASPEYAKSRRPGQDEGPEAYPDSTHWTDWILQSVSETRAEKAQIVETFGEPVVYMFGERPRFLNFTGILLNTADFNWRAQFWENWDKYFRGTQLVKNNARMYIGFDDILVSGYPMDAAASQSTVDPNKMTFRFSLFVTSYVNVAMRNAGALKSLRTGTPNGAKVLFTSRASEFLNGGAFKDASYDLASQADGPLADAIGGERLRALQSVKEFKDALRIGGIDTYDILFNPRLRYIKGKTTALETLLAWSRNQVNQLAYQGVDAVAASTSGGIREVNYWYGLISHMYRVVAVNALRAADLGPTQANNRWSNLIDTMATLGNPYALASYMGYTATAQISEQLYKLTDRYELSNMRSTLNYGLVSKTQSSAYGDAISARNEPVAVQDSSALTTLRLSQNELRASTVGDTTGFDSPEGPRDEARDPAASALSTLGVEDAAERERSERDAVNLQEEKRSVNHGALTVVEDPAELEDDGSA